MPTLRERFASVVLRPEYRRLTGSVEALNDVMARRSQWFSAEDLSELDSQTIDLLVRHAADRELTRTWTPAEAEQDRLRAVKESRHLYRYDVVSKRIIGLWTDFGYGKQMEVIPRDAGALEVWKEFVGAQRNAPILKPRRVHMLSDTVLKDGEIYLAFFVDKTNGDCTVRRFNTDQITQLVPDVDDEDSILYYKREWTSTGDTMPQVLYYRDWQAEEKDLAQIKLPVEARKADGEMSETDVVMMQIAHDEDANRGWPLMTAGAVWTRAYKNFLQDRAAVAKAVASVVDKLTAKGGSRGIEAIRRRLESSLMNATSNYETNPPPVAGSTWIENEALSRQRMPLSTGAGDAQIDGAALLGMVGLSGGIYAHWLGRGEAFRLATACYSEDTEVLTENGWKKYTEWQYPERIASYNREKKSLEYVIPTALHVYPYKDKMVHIKGRSVDALVTPNHRMLASNDSNYPVGDFEIVRAEDLPRRFSLPARCDYSGGTRVDKFILPGYSFDTQFGRRTIPDRVLDMDAWLAFLGWWLAEGNIYKRKDKPAYHIEVGISGQDTENIAKICAIVSKLPFHMSFVVGEMARWRCSDKSLYTWLKENCGTIQPTRRIPSFVFGLPVEQSSILLESLWDGDGHREDCEHYKGVLTSTSRELLDGALILMIRAGDWGRIQLQRAENAKKDVKKSYACYVLYRGAYEKLQLDRQRNVNQVDYDGSVWCFEVPPNGLFVTRRLGVPLIAGNTAMESPTYRQFLRYQAFWEDAWRDIAKVVFWAKTEYGGGSFEDEEVDIASDAIIQTDIRLLSMALGMAVDKEFVTPDIALERFLSALGVKNVATIVADEAENRKERQAIDDAAAAQARAAAAVKAKTDGVAPPGASNKDAATMLARNASAKKMMAAGGDGEDGE